MLRRPLPFSPGVRLLAAGALLTAAALVMAAPSSVPRVALFLLLTACAAEVRRRSPGPLSTDRLVRASLLLAVAVGLLLPAAIGLVRELDVILAALTDLDAAINRRDVLATLAVLGCSLVAAWRWPRALGDRAFLGLATVAALAMKLAWVHLVRVEPVSDFKSMWEMASGIPVTGLGPSEYSSLLRSIYHERILPYLLPLRLLFGPQPSTYSVANVAAGVATSWLAYLLARRWFGAAAARVSFVLSLIAIETVLAAEIPSHDIPGALYTVLGLVAFDAAYRLLAAGRRRTALAVSAAFGLLAVVVDLQRSTGLLFLLTCGGLGSLAAVVSEGTRQGRWGQTALRTAVVLIAAPLLVFEAADWGLHRAGMRVPPEKYSRQKGMGLAAMTDSWSDGSWDHFEYQYRVPYGELPVDWHALAVAKLATEVHHSPLARLTAYVRKARNLFDLGSQTYFYVRGGTLAGVGTVEGRREARVALVSRCFTAVFVVFLLLGCFRLWREPGVPLVLFVPLCYLALLAGLLIVLSQVQPRYLYQIWYIGAIYAGLPCAPPGREAGLRDSPAEIPA